MMLRRLVGAAILSLLPLGTHRIHRKPKEVAVQKDTEAA